MKLIKKNDKTERLKNILIDFIEQVSNHFK